MKKQVLYSIVCLLLVFVSFSCSNDTESDEAQILKSKVQKDVDFIIKTAKTIRKEVEGNRNLLPNFSTQSELDNYLVLVGEPPGSVSLSFFNQVLGGIGMAETEGLQNLLNQSSYSAFAKSTFLTNSSGEIIPDLTQQADFLNLNISEKETVLLTNTLINDLPPEFQSPECGVAIIAGISIGGAICGPPCSIGGAVVGIVVCFWIKGHQQ
jgi:hypothetical protein